MQVTVYLDIIFIINFLVDFYVLLITGWLNHQRVKISRIVIGALFGSILFLPLIFCPKLLCGIPGIVILTGTSMGAVLISLGKEGGFIRKWFLSTTIMFLFGGVFHYVKNSLGVPRVKLYTWLIIFPAAGLLGGLMVSLLIRARKDGNYIVDIRINHNGRVVDDSIFIDSGNRLWDVIYGKPVILLSEELSKKILSNDEWSLVEAYKKNGYIDYSDLFCTYIQKRICFHEIAYQSVGNSSGKLLCFIVESVEITNTGKVYKKQPAAIADSQLFAGKNYQGLLFADDI